MVSNNLVKALGLLVRGCEADRVVGLDHIDIFNEDIVWLIKNWETNDAKIIRINGAEIHLEKDTDGYTFSIMIERYPHRLWLRWK